MFTFFVIAFLTAQNALCAYVDFFQQPGYIGLLSSATPSSGSNECKNFESVARKQISSAKVVDTCVILFDTENCAGLSIKIDADVTDFSALEGNGTNDNFNKAAVSYKFCGSGEGDENVRVDFYDQPDYEGQQITSYKDICKCLSLPNSLLVNVTSVDNHHNCIELFTTTNCVKNDETLTLYAGRSTLSGDISGTPAALNLQSLIPCKIPSKCVQLTAKLYHFEIEEADAATVARQSTTSALSMSAKTVVTNNGSATVSQEYSATRAVREVVEVETIDTHRTVQSWTTETTTTSETKINAIFYKKTVTEVVKNTYSRTEEHESTRREKHTTDVLTEFTARQTIQINPCHYYEVESFVTVIENHPIFYKAFFKFSGYSAGQQMTAEELERAVVAQGEFFFHEKIDDWTVSAYAISNITVSFGVETEIHGNGYRLRNCVV